MINSGSSYFPAGAIQNEPSQPVPLAAMERGAPKNIQAAVAVAPIDSGLVLVEYQYLARDAEPML